MAKPLSRRFPLKSWNRALFDWPVNLLARTRHIYDQIGLEESYWSESLRS
jgi:hypothetical protein